ncbi:MAG: radical SAM protein [Candidatus Thermoplasmatota archaeon]|nr:radical SAM protein [Euryarchaeota archaeon]MBU4031270.1 radical SAM protein [Candidatus Thermoplasmatota archaeon]MBU4071244.1 radical SAM protein [Candidatus Thermoplasmatota archaeon]MBU4143511.1 radical SAM protein [Candidatus Thermoplasmatota archaeon]MBU4591977.1 radical SAM protein [Candidatus Thermoplasmatota archaeon]
MVALDKIIRLASGGQFDSSGPDIYSRPIDLNKVKILGEGTKHDTCASTASKRKVGESDGRIGDVMRSGICHAFAPDGRCVSLFKTLFTNACQHNCAYCPNSTKSSGSGIAAYTPEELARITLQLYRANTVEGLFLSSGVAGDETRMMEQMLEAVELLRHKYNFMGYIHLKILPGASRDHIKRAAELVDRVSLNVETPSKSFMHELSSTKDFEVDILRRQKYIRDAVSKDTLPAGQTTQYVVGAAGESDREIFTRMLYEYNVLGLKRQYFSSFIAVDGTPLHNMKSQPRWRENRLYQADWLHRIYGYHRKEMELAFDDEGFIGNRDPKWAIAMNILDGPLDPNIATREELLRVPGIGPKSAYRIVNLRKKEKITRKVQLKALGVRVGHARTFLKLDGWCDSTLKGWM